VHNTWEDALSEMKLLLYPIEQPVTVQSPNEVITITEKHQEPDPSIVKAMTIEAPLNEMEK